MFSTLLNIMMNRVSPDDTPAGYASGIEFHEPEFILGLFVGIIITTFIFGTIIAVRAEMKKQKGEKSDE